jgi:hypothetical protein
MTSPKAPTSDTGRRHAEPASKGDRPKGMVVRDLSGLRADGIGVSGVISTHQRNCWKDGDTSQIPPFGSG